jgi:hypothetical protein
VSFFQLEDDFTAQGSALPLIQLRALASCGNAIRRRERGLEVLGTNRSRSFLRSQARFRATTTSPPHIPDSIYTQITIASTARTVKWPRHLTFRRSTYHESAAVYHRSTAHHQRSASPLTSVTPSRQNPKASAHRSATRARRLSIVSPLHRS